MGMVRPKIPTHLLKNIRVNVYFTLDEIDDLDKIKNEKYEDMSWSDFLKYRPDLAEKELVALEKIFTLTTSVNVAHAVVTGKPVPISEGSNESWKKFKQKVEKQKKGIPSVDPTIAKLNEMKDMFKSGQVKPSQMAKPWETKE